MKTGLRRSSRVLCLILAIVGLIRCDNEVINGNASSSPSQASNATFLTFPSQVINEVVKEKHNSSYNNNNKVHVKSTSWYYGGSGGGGGGGGSGGGWKCGKRKGGGRGVHHYQYKPYNKKGMLDEKEYRGMRLECSLHCSGPRYHDCHHMCKAYCRRP
ncbi:hypothetical protein JHK85_009135 [Glycine max]|uniref:Uncharacterized protein n=1 Tax=Glycine soja TaxID=3848 RepID=A0A445KVN8_GLYSO|nr:hypothetical protein JHK85_009135 [Glycine max]RZC14708.1 hypothetical protein D0Y65_008584 [Glycine soja]